MFSKTVSYVLKGPSVYRLSVRNFLSPAYYCNETWEDRLQDPIIEKVNLPEFYNEMHQRYQKTKTISAVDVDIYANAVNDSTYVDELLDLVHKLRLSGDSSNTLNSTHHAVIRCLHTYGRHEELLKILDDRLNYGMFLDNHATNLLFDTFWKAKDFSKGVRVAAQLMLQEDYGNPLNDAFALLHCYNYLLDPVEWPPVEKIPEPEEEVKVRVKYVRNPYFDGHFDLTDPLQITGKILTTICKNSTNSIHRTMYVTGLVLREQQDELEKYLVTLKEKNIEILDTTNLLPDSNPLKAKLLCLKLQSVDLQNALIKDVEEAVSKTYEKDIMLQQNRYLDWKSERKQALQRQEERALRAMRLENLEVTKKALKDKELLLWFFKNEENIELAIENKKESEIQKGPQKKLKEKEDEEYIPPEITKNVSSNV